MKKFFRIFLFGTLALSAVSCEQFLDINENPNQATASSPQQVLPNALTVTAANLVSYNDYGAWHVGYLVNAGGFGGWGTQWTYNYTTSTYNSTSSVYTGMWGLTYDNLEDYDYIEEQTEGNEVLAYYNAIAKIMKAYNFQMLVDTYGNVPYTEALAGTENLTPKYDDAEAIYQDLVTQLDAAIAMIDNPEANAIATGDVLFNGNMNRWKQFANTIKLRILIRASRKPIAGNSQTPEWVTAGFASFGANTAFLTDDAIVNPGYAATAGKQNPFWDYYHLTSANATTGTGRSRIPSDYVFSFYDGTKIDDPYRGDVTYRSFPSTPTNQLGISPGDGEDLAPNGTIAWYVGENTGASATNTVGLFKGRGAGTPILLAAESYLLQSEAMVRGFLAGDAKMAFENGITSSFRYLYKGADNAVDSDLDPEEDAAAYITDNTDNYLVNFDMATTFDQKLEAIITQKYIALNMIHGAEAWNEYRRTGYPSISGNAPTTTFASTQSTSSRADRLPTRILYPATEYSFNPSNIPADVNQFTSRIFWDID